MAFPSISKIASFGPKCPVLKILMLANHMIHGLWHYAITLEKNLFLHPATRRFSPHPSEMFLTLLLDQMICLPNMLVLESMLTRRIFARDSSSRSTTWKFLFEHNKCSNTSSKKIVFRSKL